MGYVLLYLVALAGSKFASVLVNETFKSRFIVELFHSGQKINQTCFEKIEEKYRKQIKTNIIDAIPLLCIIQNRIRMGQIIKTIKKDPAFISNLVDVTEADERFIFTFFPDRSLEGFNVKKLSTLELFNEVAAIMAIFDRTEQVCDVDLDFGTLDQEELNINSDGRLSKDVVDKMKSAEREYKKTDLNKNFYMLTDPYTLSEVFHIDENAIFVLKDGVLGLALLTLPKRKLENLLVKVLSLNRILIVNILLFR